MKLDSYSNQILFKAIDYCISSSEIKMQILKDLKLENIIYQKA